MLHNESFDWMFSEGMCCSVVQGEGRQLEKQGFFLEEKAWSLNIKLLR